MLLVLPLLVFVVMKATNIKSRASGVPANVVVDAGATIGFLPRPWRGIAQGGEALTTFMDGLEGQMKELSFRYIRIDHIYDGFDVVRKDGDQITFDWSRLDALVDKMQKAGATPLFALSYMPLPIAQTDIVSTPKNWDDWSLVIQKTIEHYSGEKKISNVYYEVWNEPDLFGKFTASTYLPLYRAAARGAGRVSGAVPFKFGGPATTGLYKSWVEELLTAAEKEKLRLDFISWHRYDTSSDRHIKDIAEVESYIANHPYFSDVEVLITEWGPYSDNNPAYDNIVGAAHLLSVVRQQMGRINLAFLFQVKDGEDPGGQTFWGRWGLFSSDKTGNKPKPRYTALGWLNSLGQDRLAMSGEGSWVTGIAARRDKTIQTILVNYDISGLHSETVPVKFVGLLGGTYTYRERYIGGGAGKTADLIPVNGEISQLVLLRPNESVMIELAPRPQ